jgi:drug/metabolite transporter (DMT)-like permease
VNPVFVIGFAFAMAMVGVFSALALSGGLAPVAIVAVRSVGVALILAVYLGFARIPLRLPARDLARVVAIGLVMSVNNFSLTSAISRIPVPLATMLF